MISSGFWFRKHTISVRKNRLRQQGEQPILLYLSFLLLTCHDKYGKLYLARRRLRKGTDGHQKNTRAANSHWHISGIKI